MKTRYFLLIIFLQISLTTFGQKGFDPGYVITNNFDTVRGFIKIKPNDLNSKSCEFMKSGDQNPKTYSPEDIRSYRIGNRKYYVSKEVVIDSVMQKVFLEYLVNGIADLYYLKLPEKEYFFIDKGNLMTELSNEGKNISVVVDANKFNEREVTYYKPSNQYKRMLKVLFQDSPEIMKKIDNTNFEYRSLINITVDYHNSVCKDRSCIDYTKSNNQNIFIEPFAGIIISDMILKESTGHDINTLPYFGFQLRFKPFKGSTLWDLLFGLSYSTNNFDGFYKNSLEPSGFGVHSIVTWELACKYSILRIPVSAEYTFATKKLKPFFSIGFDNILILNPSYHALMSGSMESSPFRTYQASLMGGFGLKWQFKNTSYLFIKNEIEYRRPVAFFGWIFDYHRVLSDLVSVGFGIRIK
jgi:hypothetical protein